MVQMSFVPNVIKDNLQFLLEENMSNGYAVISANTGSIGAASASRQSDNFPITFSVLCVITKTIVAHYNNMNKQTPSVICIMIIVT